MTLSDKKLDKFDLENETQAELAVQGGHQPPTLSVTSVEARPRQPHTAAPPFMTSTLQQEASRKFGNGAPAPR